MITSWLQNNAVERTKKVKTMGWKMKDISKNISYDSLDFLIMNDQPIQISLMITFNQ